jgi:single-strand DNA-binding protein
MTQTTSQKKTAIRTQTQDVWTRNEVVFMGYLGRDPDMNYTNNGKAVTKFSLAVNQGKDKDAMWLNVVCWQQLAEEVFAPASQISKGALVQVIGRLTQRKYKDKYYYDVVADTVELIKAVGGKEREEEDADSLGDPDEHPF